MEAVQVWWSSLVAAEHDLLGLLDATERGRVRSLQRSADRGRSMVAAALLRVAAGGALGIDPRDVVVDRTCAECGRPHGRPRILAAEDPAPQVSVSHSGLLVVVALARGVPVGVDVQRIGDLGDDADAEHQASAWVRREAVLKLGDGVVRPAVRALGAPRPGYAAALATAGPRPPDDHELDVRHWPPDGRSAPQAGAADPAAQPLPSRARRGRHHTPAEPEETP